MEQRKIIIVDSATNRKVTVNTDATSFGELKRAAHAAGIDYEGKDWLEGLTKTSPVSDDSLLPVNVNYKGTVTNNLVYMLTNTNKRIKSGMTRQEVYTNIRSLDIADEIKEKFGRNYTQVKTDDLVAFIDSLKAEPDVCQECAASPLYDKIVMAIAKFIAALPEEVLEEASKIAENFIPETPVEEIDFSKLSVYELKKRFG